MSNTVLITGASSGFGEACARLYASKGHPLVLLARRGDRLQQLADELSPLVNVHILVADVTKTEALLEALQSIPDAFLPVNILINNAGLALGLDKAQDADWQDWQVMVDTNITGLLAITHHLLPAMVASNSGHVINIASTAASWPYPGGNTYGASKAFVQQFSRGLRADLLGTRVRVSTLSPGMAETDFSKVRFHGDESKAAAVYANAKALSAEDIADIVYWITSVPPHVNVNELEVMPVDQAWGPLAVHRHPS
ncbi:SDR family NAD(P)-dependent oxidoreductase [Teredinibacter turnerae]|uniref:SDR family NAD(P)-dependent oxidoreductase n=1 Tax=Teredinibacter turnerae TaxID=2426 RepID=UPI0030D0C6A3